MRFRARGARRALVASALLTLTALTVVAGGSAARSPEASGTEGLIDAQWTPVGLRDAKTTVVVELAGKPVTVVEADAGRSLDKAEKAAVKADLQAKQNGLKGDIQALGGEVLGDYQVAYNGIKVRIDRSQLNSLKALNGVTGVHGLQRVTPDNVKGVQLIGAPTVWGGLAALHGENIKVAVIDTGIDYTHANFGGPGTVAAFQAADAADTLPPSVAHGWNARVKGGVDLVGDDYNADPDSPDFQPVPHPDPNPLDCNGHGSHVAGTAAGSGVTAAGATYTGPYNASTITGNSWRIGPGVAPKADIYGIRVFGCDGSTDVTVDAIEWAVDQGMDVINMSLGSAFGSKDDPSAVASTNAAKAGVIVVTSAGNSGPSQYITGSPGTGEGSIATAAIDASPSFPGAVITIPSGPMTAVNANEFALPPTATYTVKTIVDNPLTTVDPDGAAGTRSADESLGCDVESFGGPLPPNTIAVVVRGTCARVAKAIFGQKAGAAAVVMVDNTTNLPPVEGPITSNPDTGEQFTVTIPFLGVRGLASNPASDGGRLRAANGQSATVTPSSIANPNFKGFAGFSSGGPRTGDSGLKPNITGSGCRGRLDRRRYRQRPGDDLRHLDGLAARGGRRRADAAGAPVLECRGHQGGDHEHRRSVAGRHGGDPVPHQPRRHRARPAGEFDGDAGDRQGERRPLRDLGQLRLRGAEERLLEDAGHPAREQRLVGGDVQRRRREPGGFAALCGSEQRRRSRCLRVGRLR